jgi:hypothetical protein
VFDLAKERYLLHRLLLRLFCGRSRREEQRQGREVGVKRRTQSGLVQRRGGVIHGKEQKAVGGLSRLAMDSRDRLPREELPHRVATEGDDYAWLQDLEMAPQPLVACRYLFW